MYKINFVKIVYENSDLLLFSIVNAARNQFSQLMNLTRLLDEQKERVNQAGVQVSKNLLELKEKIRQARQLAKSVSILPLETYIPINKLYQYF